MTHADLHVHTTRSDGSMAPDEVAAVAREAGLSAVAVTDHDRLHPGWPPVRIEDGVEVIAGIELRVTADDLRIDLLGYGVDPTPELAGELDRIQRNRIERGRAIVECVEDRLGVSLDVELSEGVGRPHVARAVAAHPETDRGYEAVFEDLIGSGRPCYVARDIPSFERGRRLLAESCGLVALAHPLRYDDPERALELAADLDAVELHYPYGRDVDREPVRRAVDRHDLLVTGGTDAHDRDLGVAGLSAAEYRPVRERLD